MGASARASWGQVNQPCSREGTKGSRPQEVRSGHDAVSLPTRLPTILERGGRDLTETWRWDRHGRARVVLDVERDANRMK